MAQELRSCLPEELRLGDIVTAHGPALWRVVALDVGFGRKMIEVVCIDPKGVKPFYINYRKQFVRAPLCGTWDRMTEVAR